MKGIDIMKIFVKRIDENEEVQVVTIDEEGYVYVDVMDVEEFNQVYLYSNYFKWYISSIIWHIYNKYFFFHDKVI